MLEERLRFLPTILRRCTLEEGRTPSPGWLARGTRIMAKYTRNKDAQALAGQSDMASSGDGCSKIVGGRGDILRSRKRASRASLEVPMITSAGSLMPLGPSSAAPHVHLLGVGQGGPTGGGAGGCGGWTMVKVLKS